MSDEITRAEAAEIYGVLPATFGQYAKKGLAPAPVRHVGRTPVWSRRAVEAAAKSRPGQGKRSDLDPL